MSQKVFLFMPALIPSSEPTTSVKGWTKAKKVWYRLVTLSLSVSFVLLLSYAAISLIIVTQLIYVPPQPIYKTPAALGLAFRNVSFVSREDHVQLKGWLIPGVLPNGVLTTHRTIILVHGNRTNRADKDAGLLTLSGELAHHGFAVFAFDMRGMGESSPAPLSLGYFEQRDVLGAVDFLRTGPLPFPNLGRPHAIGGWGVSMGAATLLLAAAHEQALHAIVSDSAYADIIPLLERELPKGDHLSQIFTPGILFSARVLYGIDFYAVRPVDVVDQLAPRPLLFIHGEADHDTPPSNTSILSTAARTAPNAHIQTWFVPGATHAQSFNTHKDTYINLVVNFYTKALGTDTGTGE